MGYKDLSPERKLAIQKNADAYNKQNYRAVTFRLLPATFERLDEIAKKEGLSRTGMIDKLINKYK